MKVITECNTFAVKGKTAITLGKFDGLHKGHQSLLHRVLKKKDAGIIPTVFTFDVAPLSVIEGRRTEVLLTNQERREQLQAFGIELMIECPFTKEIASMMPEDFIRDILIKQCKAVYIAVGEDFRFGNGAAGDAAMLLEYQKVYGYEIDIIQKEKWNGIEISSTLVREELLQGHMETVTKLLGQPYFIDEKVVGGNQIGRTIGMPTANQVPPKAKMLPPLGVYITEVEWNGNCYGGVTNIGYKPTVTDEKVLGIETYIYSFQEQIYGERIRVSFLRFLRPELKFSTFEELKEQMQQDMQEGRKYLVDKGIQC